MTIVFLSRQLSSKKPPLASDRAIAFKRKKNIPDNIVHAIEKKTDARGPNYIDSRNFPSVGDVILYVM